MRSASAGGSVDDTVLSTGRPLGNSVLVVGRQPVVRAGLRGLVEEAAGMVVAGQSSSIREAGELAIDADADAVLVAWEADDAEELALLARSLSAAGVPVVLLGDAPSAPELTQLLGAGIRGFLLAEAGAEDVAAGLRAAVRGLLVLDPLLGRTLTAEERATPSPGAPGDEPLTEREREVLQLLALGLPNKTIAQRLRISEHTAKFHVGSILAKLQAASRTEAVTRAARRGLLTL